jgi:sugar/nucleoside kinase (ribokinase family)
MSLKIGVIGTINRDTIVRHDGEKVEGWGGILYNLKTFSNLAPAGTNIYPVCNVGHDCYNDIVQQLKKLTRVRLDYINKVPEKNNHCFLTYTDPDNKTEILKGGVPPLKFDDVKPLLDCETVLMNFISGRDIEPGTLKKIRKEYRGLIYTDIHSFTLGKRRGGKRYLRSPKRWPEIVSVSDFIQLNRMELAVLVEDHEDFKPTEKTLKQHLDLFYRRLTESNVNYDSKYVIVTNSNKGCYISRKGAGRASLTHVSPGRKILSGDSTGCGDCFSAGFILDWIQNKSILKAAKAGNKAAARRIESDGKFL